MQTIIVHPREMDLVTRWEWKPRKHGWVCEFCRYENRVNVYGCARCDEMRRDG